MIAQLLTLGLVFGWSRLHQQAVRTNPEPPAAVVQLVRRSRLPAVRSIDIEIELPEYQAIFFSVTYGRELDWGLYQHAQGLLYRGRVGWTATERAGYTSAETDSLARGAEWFPLRADDSPLMSENLLRILDQRAEYVGQALREFLARNAATPIEVLRRLIRDKPRWNAVAQNQRLADPATPWNDLRSFAALSPEVAQVVLSRSDVRNDPTRVYEVTKLPEYPSSGTMQWSILRQFHTFAPTLLSDPQAPEALLLELFYSMQFYYQDTGLMRALFQHPATRQSATLTTLFASPATGVVPSDLAAAARDRLFLFRLVTVDDAKLALVRRVRADTSLPPFAFYHAANLAGRSWPLLHELSQIHGRDSAVERTVREALAGSDAPLAVLRRLAKSLAQHPDYGVATNLFFNRVASKDRQILTILSRLDTTKVRDVPRWADSLLHESTQPEGHP